jgi:reverse gyrase
MTWRVTSPRPYLEEEEGRLRATEAVASYGSGGVGPPAAEGVAAAGENPTLRLWAAEELHGDCSQGQRSRALDAFASGACRILVATDVASRGLDLPEVRHVINFDLPTDGKSYMDIALHVIGCLSR